MGDFYTEQLIKKQGDMKDLVIKAVLVAVAIVSVLTVFIFPMGLILLWPGTSFIRGSCLKR